MKKLSIIKRMANAIKVVGCCLLVIGMSSCSDMLETESELVEYERVTDAAGNLLWENREY